MGGRQAGANDGARRALSNRPAGMYAMKLRIPHRVALGDSGEHVQHHVRARHEREPQALDCGDPMLTSALDALPSRAICNVFASALLAASRVWRETWVSTITGSDTSLRSRPCPCGLHVAAIVLATGRGDSTRGAHDYREELEASTQEPLRLSKLCVGLEKATR